MYTYTYLYMYTYTHIYIYKYTYTYTQIYIYIHIHRHTQPNKQTLGCESSSDRTDLQQDDKLPGPHGPLVFLSLCLSSCTQFCIQSTSHHLPRVRYEELWCSGSREHTTPSRGEAYAHRPEDERFPVRELICPVLPPALPPLGSLTHANSRSSSVGARPPAHQLPLVSQYFLFYQ